MNIQNWETQLRKGVLELVVLNFLSKGKRHGYEMVRSLKTIEALEMREGNIYPILSRLQVDGLVKSETVPSQDGPPRKYFEITESGTKMLGEMNSHWDKIVAGIDRIRKGEIK